jgi:S-layer protein
VITITAAVAGTAFTFTSVAATSGGGAADVATGTFATTTANVSAVTASGLLTIDNLASGGTVDLISGGAGATVVVKDAALVANTTDVLNVVTKVGTANLTHGTVTAANVETINLTATDTSPLTATGTASIQTSTLTLTAAAATTVTVNGNAALTLTMTGSDKVTSINGSAMTGALTVTSVNTTSATTITGGAGNDALTSAATSSQADVLIGGAGNDTLTASKGLTTLTGGAGNDTFVIPVASVNSSSFATITDFSSVDKLKITGAESFTSARVALADTAVFQDYANAAIAAITANNGLAWFQFSGNTYVVKELNNADNANTFVNNEDFIVKLTGLFDLSTARFSNSDDSIVLGG